MGPSSNDNFQNNSVINYEIYLNASTAMNIVELGRRYAHAQEGALALGFDANLTALADGLSKFPCLSHVQHRRRSPCRVIFKTANVQVVRQLLLEQTFALD